MVGSKASGVEVSPGVAWVQMRPKTLHAFAKFGRYPLNIAWQAQAAKYPSSIEIMPSERVPQKASFTDCTLPSKVCWHSRFGKQLRDYLVPTPRDDNPSLQNFSLQSALAAFVDRLAGAVWNVEQGHNVYQSIKKERQTERDRSKCEPYIQVLWPKQQ